MITLSTPPSVLRDNRFNEDGLAETEQGLLVPAYIGSQLGFNVPGRFFLEKEFHPRLRAAGVLPLCPFTACAEYLDAGQRARAKTFAEAYEFWDAFNHLIGPVNYGMLMPRAKFMIAILDGGHVVDDGVAAEIGYFAVKQGSAFGIRSDFRLSENLASSVNAAVRNFLDYDPQYHGRYFVGDDAYDEAFVGIADLSRRLRNAA